MAGLGVPTVASAMDRWAALSMIESGDDDNAIGPGGEISPDAPGAPGGCGGSIRDAARRTAAPAFSVHDGVGAGDGQCGGAGVLDFPGDLLRLARIGHPRLAGQAHLCGGRWGGHGRMVCWAELGGFARPWQTEREDATADGTLLRRIPRAPCADSGRNNHLAVAQ